MEPPVCDEEMLPLATAASNSQAEETGEFEFIIGDDRRH